MGSTTGVEPVAMMTSRASIVRLEVPPAGEALYSGPSGPSGAGPTSYTSRTVEPVKLACPVTTSTPLALNREATPSVRPLTMRSLRARTVAWSSRTPSVSTP